MFTDNPTIPAQLETLLEVVHQMGTRKTTSEALKQLMQPRGLPGVGDSSAQVALHISAGLELDLVRYDDGKNLRLNYRSRGEHRAKDAILAAFDRIALGDAAVEKWAGRFYAFLITREESAVPRTDATRLTGDFMAGLPGTVGRENPMNPDKFRALMRWYPYVGLGWVDPAGSFVPDPTSRLTRALPTIWGGERTLDAGRFMERIGQACPELDGGAMFSEIASDFAGISARECTSALATALWRLHDERTIRLRCPPDSQGWSLRRAGSGVVTGEESNRFDSVELVVRATS